MCAVEQMSACRRVMRCGYHVRFDPEAEDEARDRSVMRVVVGGVEDDHAASTTARTSITTSATSSKLTHTTATRAARTGHTAWPEPMSPRPRRGPRPCDGANRHPASVAGKRSGWKGVMGWLQPA